MDSMCFRCLIQQQPQEERGYAEVVSSMNITKTLSQLSKNKVFHTLCVSLKESCPIENLGSKKDMGSTQDKSKKMIPL